MTVAPGVRVKTRQFGEGKVVRVTSAGAMVAIDLLGGLELPLTSSDFEPLGVNEVFVPASAQEASWQGPTESYTAPVASPEPDTLAGDVARRPGLTREQQAQRRAIEALRFGIVPAEGIRELTIGFEELEDWVAGCLPTTTSRPCVSEVCGGFGTGKSHTMAAVRVIAEAQDYLSVRVEVDGNSVSLSDPASVLRQLWPTLHGIDFESDTPVLDLHLRGIQRGALQDFLEEFPRVMANAAAVQTLKRFSSVDEVAEELESFLACGDSMTASDLKRELTGVLYEAGWQNWQVDPCEPKRLIGLKTDERPADFINCLLGYATLAKHCGFAGLVVTIDEFEVEYNLPPGKQDRIWDLISSMEDWLSGEIEFGDAPVAMFIATVGQQGHAGDSTVERLVTAGEGGVFELPIRTVQERTELAERIYAWYASTYRISVPFDSGILRDVELQLRRSELDAEGGLIRAFIKRYVAALDATIGPPIL